MVLRVLASEEFPENLKKVNVELPEKLWVKGKILKKDSRAVAIVGSRQMSNYGRKIAEKYASELAKAGVTIISGGARGIDSAAHKAALSVGGRTIAVLGCGVDVVYPRENAELFERIIKSGTLISEFEPGTPPLARNFLRRNRLVAAMSVAVLVIEGRRRSGTLSIANHAAEIGVEVFTVDIPDGHVNRELPNYLIESGARVANDYCDILECLI